MECLYKIFHLFAEVLALHSCPQAAWGLVYKKANKLLKLKENFTVHCGMAIGYENEKNKVNNLRTERESIKSFCKFYD